ncbi:MAG: hypothetical protein EA398_08790 [Deltaproteobacteria bacterium]|nr:MAG: hypothetical protein EA398_08790 [Deltaproteobacteria bacterium]
MVHPEGLEGSLRIHQDASIRATVLRPGERVDWTPDAGRGAWVQVVSGSGKAGEQPVARGDGLAFEREGLEFEGGERGLELVLLDLP